MINYTKGKILVVDDEPANLFLLEGILTAENFIVEVANDGYNCLEKLKTFIPDIILLDIMMPKLNGIEVLKKIVHDETYKLIPVIMVSAKTDSEDVEEALNLGASEYIKKPIDEVELLARVRAALRIKIQEDKLRTLIKSKDDFIRMVSHDIRNPFHSILGFTELLLNDPELKNKLTEEHREFLNLIFESTNFVVDYFNKLLSWSKLGNKDLELKRTDVSLHKIISSSITIYQKKIIEKEIRLLTKLPKDIIIHADETYFLQVINNILSNAIKFTPVGGEIKIKGQQNNSEIIITIADSGIGMENITPEDFFNNEFNISRKGTSGEKGTGVGMNICKKILDAHNFNISFVSELNQGTSFIIIIPH